MPIRRALAYAVLPAALALWASAQPGAQGARGAAAPAASPPAPAAGASSSSSSAAAARSAARAFAAGGADQGPQPWPGLAVAARPATARERGEPTFSVAWAHAGRATATLPPPAPTPAAPAATDPAFPPPPAPTPALPGPLAPAPAGTGAPPGTVAPAPAPDPAPAGTGAPPGTVAMAPAPAPDPAASVAGPPVVVEDEWLRRRADEAVAMIAYPWGALGYEAVFFPARPGMRGRTLLHERRIEIYARRGDSAVRTAFDLAHEIAHAFDFAFGSSFTRAEWLRARGLVGTPWYGCNACDDLGTPAGDFAESFAAWQVPGGDFSSRLGPVPDAGQRALLARLTTL